MGRGITDNRILSVGINSVKVAENDPQRKVIFIRNNSTAGQVISLIFSNNQQAEAGTGIVLGAGQYIIDSDTEGYECWEGEIHAISSAAGGLISVYIR